MIHAVEDGKQTRRRKSVYEASPLKRNRSTAAQITALKSDLYAIIKRYKPMTVRQVYYQAVCRGLIEKTESAYDKIGRLLCQMRRDGELPYQWIADNTRWMRKPRSYSGLADLLEQSQRTYRRDIWQYQDAYVEIWLEKEALAGVLLDITAEWDVPLMVTRGYPSLSFIHSAADAMRNEFRPTYLYYFGDMDPSGIDIPRTVEDGIREMAPDVDLHFKRVAVTAEQVRTFDLVTRPTKKTDSRSRNFTGESVEVDAIDPDTLRLIARDCITQHIDVDALARVRNVETAERETLARMAMEVCE